MLATFDPTYTIVKWIAAGTFTVVVGFLLVIVYWVVRDSFRFGGDDFPWMAGVGVSALFGGVASWLAGTGGLFFGVPFLVAFGLGKWKRSATSNAKSRLNHDDGINASRM